MNRVQEFLNLYNQIDVHMRSILGADHRMSHARLLEGMAKRDPLFDAHHSRLQAFRALRNSIVHTPFDGQQEPEPIAEPVPAVLDEYRMLVQYLKNPPTALDTIATREVFSVSWHTRLRDGLGYILEHGFDTIPIVESKNLVGMYTHQCLQRMVTKAMASANDFMLSSIACFGDIQEECAFSSDDPENFRNHPSLVRFSDQDSRIDAIENLFKSEAHTMTFLIVVCITEHGQAFEPLLGLITPHNLPSANASADIAASIRKRFATNDCVHSLE